MLCGDVAWLLVRFPEGALLPPCASHIQQPLSTPIRDPGAGARRTGPQTRRDSNAVRKVRGRSVGRSQQFGRNQAPPPLLIVSSSATQAAPRRPPKSPRLTVQARNPCKMERSFSVDDLVGGLYRLGQAGMGRTDSEAAFQEFLKRIPSATNLAAANNASQQLDQHQFHQHAQQLLASSAVASALNSVGAGSAGGAHDGAAPCLTGGV